MSFSVDQIESLLAKVTPNGPCPERWCSHVRLDGDMEECENLRFIVNSPQIIRQLVDEVKQLRSGWEKTAAEFAKNMEFYRGIVWEIGEMFGKEAKTSDDGSVQDSVLALKVPELVRQLLERVKYLEQELSKK